MMKIKNILAGSALTLSMLFTGYSVTPLVEPAQEVLIVRADDDVDPDKINSFAETLKQDTADGSYRFEDDTVHKGSELWKEGEDGYPVLNDDTIVKLKAEDQQKFFSRLTKSSKNALEKEENRDNPDYTTTTANKWWQEMQSVSGVGAQYVAQLTDGLKVDLQAGNSFFQPVNKIIGVVLGILCVMVMAMLTLSFMIDILYITVPIIRMGMDNSGNGKGHSGHGGMGMSGGGMMGGSRGGSTGGPGYVSPQAKLAVKEEEGGANALWYYFRKSVVKIVVLVLCLMVLISGQIYGIIGIIMNIVAAMFGFH